MTDDDAEAETEAITERDADADADTDAVAEAEEEEMTILVPRTPLSPTQAATTRLAIPPFTSMTSSSRPCAAAASFT